MIGLVMFLGILLAVRVSRRLCDRGELERRFVKQLYSSNYVWPGAGSGGYSSRTAEPGNEFDALWDAIGEAGYRAAPVGPIGTRQYARMRRHDFALLAVPVGVGIVAYALHAELGVNVVVLSLVLSTVTACSAAFHARGLKWYGYNPVDGKRDPFEWALLLPVIVVRIAIAAAGYFLAAVAIDAVNAGDVLGGLMRMIGAVVLLGAAHIPVRVAERLLRKARRADFAASAPPESSLLLRSFADDDIKVSSWVSGFGPSAPQLVLFRGRFEEQVVFAMLGQGPLLAIGRPGEKVPHLGAARTYWANEDWQDAVKVTAHRAHRVVMIAGITKGLQWEFERLREWGLLRKTLILLPPDSALRTGQRLARVLHDLGIDNFPAELCWPMFMVAIGFDSDDTPVFYISEGRHFLSYWAAIAAHQKVLVGAEQVPPSRRDLVAAVDRNARAFVDAILPEGGEDLARLRAAFAGSSARDVRTALRDFETTKKVDAAGDAIRAEAHELVYAGPKRQLQQAPPESRWNLNVRLAFAVANRLAASAGDTAPTDSQLIAGALEVAPQWLLREAGLLTRDAACAVAPIEPAMAHADERGTKGQGQLTDSVLPIAASEAEQLGHMQVDVGHLLLALNALVPAALASAAGGARIDEPSLRACLASEYYDYLKETPLALERHMT